MIKKLTLTRRLVAAGLLSLIGIVGITNVNAQQPIAHFPLDSDGNSANGEFTASTVTDVEFGATGATGNTGTSATFNGSSSLIQHDWSADLNPEGSFTLTVWAKSNGGAGAWNSPVTSRHDLNPDSQGYLIYDNNPNGVWTFWSGNGTVDGNWQALDGPEVNLEEWDHVAIVYDDELEIKQLYVNGELAVEANDSVFPNDTTPFNIGAGEDTGTGFHFKGDLDDIGLWDVALTESQIVQVMNNGVANLNGGGGGSTLTNGLTGYWPLDEGSGTTAANSAGGEDAELHNGVEWIDDPDRGSVLSFDGVDGYADAGAEAIPQMTQDNDFTWSVWINQAGGNGPNNVVLGNRYSPEGGDFAPREFIKFTPTQFEFHRDGGGQNCDYIDLVDSEGEWVHYVVVKTGNTLTHYSNGEVGESSTFTGELQNPQPLYFGGDQANENWSGMLDDIAIWERALSADEVAELNANGIIFAAPVARSLEEGLIGYWPFDDKSDGTEDISESGNEGTVNGGAEFVTGHTGKAHDSAIQFDGTDDSVTTEAGLLNDLDELTLSFWILMPEQQAGNRVGLIGQNDAVEYGMINPTTMQYWTPVGAVDVAYGPTVDEWSHVAVIVDGDGMRVYSDGEMIAENAGAGGAVTSGDTFNMGGDGVFDATGNWFLGSLDDVAVWNIGLSDEDIADLASGAAEPIPVTPAGGSLVETVPDLIAYWPFDGDLDDAVGNSHGTGQGGDPIAFADGQFGEGIALDGVDQFVETPVDNEEMFDFQDGTGFSISAWFTVDSFSKNWQALIAKGEGNRWRVHRRGGEGILTGNGGNADVPAGPTDVNDGEIHHLVLVSDPDGGEVRLYVDGELESTGGAPGIESNDNPMMIGENPDARNRTWHGMIDDVGIWARPITDDEIATIWNGGSGKPLMFFQGGGAPPLLGKLIPNAAGFVMNVKDGATTFTDKDLSVSIDGVAVENVTTSTVGGVTAITAQLPAPMVAGSVHVAKATFSDSGGSTVRLEKEYEVPAYSVIIPGLKAAGSLKGDSGFVAYATQISLGQNDLASVHGGEAGAMEQFLGLTMDSASGDTFLNEADGDSFDTWTYFAEVIDVVNQTDDLESDDDGNSVPAISGKFNAETGHPDDILTGIESSWDDSQTDGYVNGYLALLDLTAGAHTFGLNVKNGYIASIAPDFGASAGSQVGGAKKTFNIFVEEAGLYPLQILFYEAAAKAYIELYSIVNGVPVLVNDSNTDGSIKAYTIKGAETGGGIEEIVSTGRASVVSVSPSDGSMARSAQIKVVVHNASTSVEEDSVILTLNGESVDVSVSKDGDQVTISYDGSPIGPNTAVLSYGESDGSGNQIAWSFDYAAIYANKAPVPTSAGGGITVHEYRGTGGGSLVNLFGDENFPNTPTGSLVAGYFEWPQTGDIEVQPAGNIWDNYGLMFMGYVHPPETGEYFFYGSSDDNMETWLSTDSDPANAKLILKESGWRNPRDFQAQGSEETSGPIFLEAGKAYYVEMIKKEGGGGDNAALAWSTPEDEGADVDVGGLPISGEYLSPYIWTGPLVPELGATSPTGILSTTEYDVSVTVNNGEKVKVAEFTKLEVGGESLLGEAEIALSAVSSSIKAYGDGEPSTELTAIVEWKNDDGSTGSGTWSFMTTPHGENALYMEVEDFNYDGGEWMTFEDTAGGGAYEGLEFVADVDIHNNGNASENYRIGNGNHPGMADSLGFDGNRGEWDMDVDFKMGWNDAGDWYNYTRDFAAKETYYNVIGRFSSGGAALNIDLSRVTGDTTTTDQTTELLGNFSGPATACWDCMEFFPLKDAAGNAVPIKIGGETTLRLTMLPGSNEDMNYVMFVPSAIQEFPPTIVSTEATASNDGAVSLTVVLTQRELALADAQLSVNGQAVDTAVATDGDTITLTGAASGLSPGEGTATVSFNGTSTDWTFTVAALPALSASLSPASGTTGVDAESTITLNVSDGATLLDVASVSISLDGTKLEHAVSEGTSDSGKTYSITASTGALAGDSSHTISATFTEVAGQAKPLADISNPGDAVVPTSDNHPAGEHAGLAIDDNTGTKYLNFDGANNTPSGLTITTGGGVVTGLGLTSANDAADRDPATFVLSGSNDGGATLTEIASGDVPAFGARFERQEVSFANEASYTTYELIFPTTTGSSTCCMQIAEVELLAASDSRSTTIASSFSVRSYHLMTRVAAGSVSYIEAEDFNYDGGSYKTFEDVGTGGTYEGLGAVTGIDFNNSGNASEKYRVIPDNHPGMTESMWDSGRNGFDMTVDFKMGWNDDGDWYNYTRDFAAGSYAVFGRFSSGGAAINNELSLVTGDATAADQTVESLGTFTGPATGAWDTMGFFPLNNEDGELATVTLGGTSTVRLTKVGGNMDVNYLAFVPIEEVILHNAEAGTVSYIEAEDFNYDGGSYKTFEDVGTGGTYEGLGAVTGIDFNNSGNASEKYRVIPGNHPGMTESMWDSGRNGFDMTVDFKMGWNDDGDWYNYTRDFPEGGSYAVYGRFSSGGAAINNKLSIVTGDATAADQTVEDLGTFTGPATGAWDTMGFFPLKDADGNLAAVSLSGTSTVRLTKVGGNMDVNYLAFVPYVAPVVPGALTEPTVVDFGDLSGDASYEFFFNATKAGASTAIAGNNAFAFKLDQWNEQGIFGTTVFGVADNVFTAVEGKSVESVFDRDVHVVLVNDTAAGETRLYVDGDHVGVLDGNFELAGEGKVMGARIEANTDPMGDGSVMHKWAVYNSALSGAEIADLAAAAGGGGGDTPALSIVNNGDGTVTVTFEGTLQSADSVNGPWSDVDAPSPLTIPADQAQQYARAVTE